MLLAWVAVAAQERVVPVLPWGPPRLRAAVASAAVVVVGEQEAPVPELP